MRATLQVDTHPELEMPLELEAIPDVSDDYEACVLVEKLRNYQEDVERITDLAQRRIDEIAFWREEQCRDLKQKSDYVTMKLEGWAREKLADSKDRSVKLPGATLSLRKQPADYIRDEKAILEFLDEAGDVTFVKTKETKTLDWKALKEAGEVSANGTLHIKIADEEGELHDLIVPSVQVVEQEDSFQLTVNP